MLDLIVPWVYQTYKCHWCFRLTSVMGMLDLQCHGYVGLTVSSVCWTYSVTGMLDLQCHGYVGLTVSRVCWTYSVMGMLDLPVSRVCCTY